MRLLIKRWIIQIFIIGTCGCGQADDPAAYQARLVARFAEQAAIGWSGLTSAGLPAPHLMAPVANKSGLLGEGEGEGEGEGASEQESSSQGIRAVLDKVFPFVDEEGLDRERSLVRHAITKMRLRPLSKLGSFGQLAQERLQKLGDEATVVLRELHKGGEKEPGVAVEALDAQGKSQLVAQVFSWRWQIRVHWTLGLHNTLLTQWQPKGDGKLQSVQLLLNGEKVDLLQWNAALKYAQGDEILQKQLWLTWTATQANKSKERCQGGVCVQLELADLSDRLAHWFREYKERENESHQLQKQQKKNQELTKHIEEAKKEIQSLKIERDSLKKYNTGADLALPPPQPLQPQNAALPQPQNAELQLQRETVTHLQNELNTLQTTLEQERQATAAQRSDMEAELALALKDAGAANNFFKKRLEMMKNAKNMQSQITLQAAYLLRQFRLTKTENEELKKENAKAAELIDKFMEQDKLFEEKVLEFRKTVDSFQKDASKEIENLVAKNKKFVIENVELINKLRQKDSKIKKLEEENKIQRADKMYFLRQAISGTPGSEKAQSVALGSSSFSRGNARQWQKHRRNRSEAPGMRRAQSVAVLPRKTLSSRSPLGQKDRSDSSASPLQEGFEQPSLGCSRMQSAPAHGVTGSSSQGYACSEGSEEQGNASTFFPFSRNEGSGMVQTQSLPFSRSRSKAAASQDNKLLLSLREVTNEEDESQ